MALASSPAVGMPERLGIYRIESLLGRGGMGEVFLAWDELLERHVAIKRVLADRLADDVWRARFLREARAVARLDHPAIVRIHHVLERDRNPCLVMEFVRGQDLSKLPRGELPVARVVAVARGVAEGLAAAHAEGLIHRDLKLSNVVATPDGGVKILDFGLAVARARQAEEVGRVDAETASGVLVGTAYAMSPEQARSESLDHRSDLFSLGGLLYELLTGVRPFAGSSLFDTLRRVVTEPAEPLLDLAPEVPTALADLVHELLAKDRDQRPASARVVLERLARMARELPTAPSRTPGVGGGAGEPATLAGSPDPDGATIDLPRPIAPSSDSSGLVLRTVAHAEWVAPAAPAGDLGALAGPLAERFAGRPVRGAGGAAVFLFYRPAEAVAFALELHDRRPGIRVGVHLGEVSADPTEGAGPSGEAEALRTAALLARRAQARQTLVGRGAFDLARGARTPERLTRPEVRWLAHGAYVFEGMEDPYEVFEVGHEGVAPLRGPDDSAATRRSVGLSEEMALGWRPATGQPVPRRPGWRLVERLGEGGFGEVWLARREGEAAEDGAGSVAAGEERVFKFCFEPERLRALKRELTLFRLLRETLGHRRDIAGILDWDFEASPYFLESEYTDGGDLARWTERHGGAFEVPLAVRLELVAQVADALAAAHSVGVLHKDVKPSNVLVEHDEEGRPRARLTDFGIGLLIDRSRLQRPGFTVLGFTETSADLGTGAGTVQYMAPELLEGKPATTRADLYSLGVVLYQFVVGDFDRALAAGWERDVGDELLVEDVAACVDGVPERRLAGPAELAARLRSLGERRERRIAEAEVAAAERRGRRRRRLAGWLGSTAAVLLLVVSVFAFQTARARDLAEQRRRQAEGLIDFLLGDLRGELQPIGKLHLLDRVADEALEYFAAVPEDQLSPEEMANYSKAMHQIGQVRFALGKVPAAAEAFRESLDRAERLAASDPRNHEWQFQLGQSHFWLGYLRWQEADLDAAAEQFDAYRRISEALAATDPRNRAWQMELAFAHSNLGSLHAARGDFASATSALEASARAFEALRGETDSSPAATPQVGEDLALVYAKLGTVLQNEGRLAEARRRYESALELFTEGSRVDPDDMNLRRNVGVALNHLADCLLALGETENGLDLLQAALSESRSLVRHDPENLGWAAELALALNRVARAELALDRWALAAPLVEEEGSLVRSLLAGDPSQPRLRLSRARSLWMQSQLSLEREGPAAARAALEDAVDLLTTLVAESDAAEVRVWLARALASLGSLERAAGRGDAAVTAFRRGLEVTRSWSDPGLTPEQLEIRATLLLGSGARDEGRRALARLDALGYRPAELVKNLRVLAVDPG